MQEGSTDEPMAVNTARRWHLRVLVAVLCISGLTHVLVTLQPSFMDEYPVLGNVAHFAQHRTIIPDHTQYPPLYSYIISPFVGLWGATLALQGRLASVAELRGYLHVNPVVLFWGARLVTLICFAIAVRLVYATARAAGNRQVTSLVAATVLASSVGLVRYSGYALPDVTMMMFAAGVMYYAVCLPSSPRPVRSALLCGAVLGLALATKYTALGVALSVVTAAWLAAPSFRNRLRLLVVAAVGSVTGFLIGSPGWVLAFRRYWEGLTFEAGHMRAGHLGATGVPLLGQLELLARADPHILAIAALSVVAAIVCRPRAMRSEAIMAAAALGVLVVAAPAKKQSLQYLFAAYPAMAVLVSTGLDKVRHPRSPYLNGGVALLCLVSSVVGLHYALRWALLPDSVEVSRQWIYTHIERNASVAVDWEYVPRLYNVEELSAMHHGTTSAYMSALRAPLMVPYNVSQLEHEAHCLLRRDIDYIVTSSGCYGRFFRAGVFTGKPPPDDSPMVEEFRHRREFYRALFDGHGGWCLVYAVDTGNGPRVLVYGRSTASKVQTGIHQN